MDIDAAHLCVQSFICGELSFRGGPKHPGYRTIMKTLFNFSPVEIIFPLFAYTSSVRGNSESSASATTVKNCSRPGPVIKALNQINIFDVVMKFIDIHPASFNAGSFESGEKNFDAISNFIIKSSYDLIINRSGISISPIKAEMITFELISHHGVRTLSNLKEMARSNRLFSILSQTKFNGLISLEAQIQSLIVKAISS